MTYQLIKAGDGVWSLAVRKVSDDGVAFCIPADPANTDYQAYLQWIAEGNQPLPAEE